MELPFQVLLSVEQHHDPIISKLALEHGEPDLFALINGLVYKKDGDNVMYFVSNQMEQKLMQTHHESLCDLGAAKCHEYLRKLY